MPGVVNQSPKGKGQTQGVQGNKNNNNYNGKQTFNNNNKGGAKINEKPAELTEEEKVALQQAQEAAALKQKEEAELKVKEAEEAEKKAREIEERKPVAQRATEKIKKTLEDKKEKPENKSAALTEASNIVKGDNFLEYEPYFVSLLLPTLLEASDDKTAAVRDAAEAVGRDMMEKVNLQSIKMVVNQLFKVMNPEAKWRAKQVGLNFLTSLTKIAPIQLAACLPIIIPVVTDLMWDTKPEVKTAATTAITLACGVINNRDIEPFLPALISSLSHMDEVPETILKLASTTFVQTVDAAALSIIVPLLVRGFREKKAAIKRQCAVIVANMSKLVEDPVEAAPFLPELLPALDRAADEISDPEARSVAAKAHAQLVKIRDAGAPAAEAQEKEIGLIHDLVKTIAGEKSNDLQVPLEYVAGLCNTLIRAHKFNQEQVDKFVLPLLKNIMSVEDATKAINELLTQFAKYMDSGKVVEEDDDLEELCNCKFTLAYGAKILLHNTELKLKRGCRYGLLGGNDSGKTTLMRAIANGQVDGFPPATELRTVFVEADIQGEMSHLSCVDYIFADPRIMNCGVSRDQIAKCLQSVGFSEKMCGDSVSTLSGGWRMKLALARAMLQNADILLLDEPTNHLDVINVAWVQNYLNSLKDVTSIIVSHDSGLLDKCCTHILQIDSLKLHLHKGNLSEFVKKNPAAKSFFELSTEKFKFKFPQPGYLEGVKSKGKALMKMEDVTFTYPGNEKPTISNITVQVSMSSRVACVGVNGAGKSTMIKLLTGQLEPAVGSVWKYPNCRVAYVAQHAFHHIEQHLTKSGNEYIRWRYANGEDKEGLEKVTMIITPEEEAKLKKQVVIDVMDANGNVTKSKRNVEKLTGGRRQGKKEFEYEVMFTGMSMDSNVFMPLHQLEEMGYTKHMKQVDAKVEAREGQYARPLTQEAVETHLEDVGLEREFGTHYRMGALSGGQKVKVVLAAAMWNQPHILILDEPTNYLDRDSLAALAGAIREYEGGVVMITHNNEFCSALCPETWVLENGTLNCKGDPEWMAAALKEKTEFKMIEEMVDANGNVIKVKQPKKQLTRKERMARDKRRKQAIENGEQISDSEEDD